jgi:TetR/AcrR family transcriptional regulator, transcriptional repressor for nem operon
MARPRTFDPDDVLDAARDIFWRKGYQGTSLDDITAETGLTKPSLYAAFGDKTSLFLRTLDRYHDGILRRSEKILGDGASARAAIEAWLLAFLPYCSGARGRRGCLSINTATDGGLDDAGLHKSIAGFNARLEQMILARLQRDRVQFAQDFDSPAVASAIMAAYVGLMVLAKQAPSQEKVKGVIAQITKLLA